MESLSALNDPFLAKRDAAEEAWDNRFKDAELDCKHCEGTGWRYDWNYPQWIKCGKCQDGSIYTALCVRCQKPESGKDECTCDVKDFM